MLPVWYHGCLAQAPRSQLCKLSQSRVEMSDFAKEIIPVNLEDEMRQSYLDYAMLSLIHI